MYLMRSTTGLSSQNRRHSGQQLLFYQVLVHSYRIRKHVPYLYLITNNSDKSITKNIRQI